VNSKRSRVIGSHEGGGLSFSPDTKEPDSDRRWYAVHVRSRFEKKVHLDLLGRGVESFLPLHEEIRIWSDRRKKLQAPLFPGYVLAHFDLRDRLRVLQARGVVRLIGIRGRPSVIPDEQIEWIRIVLGHPASLRRESHVVVGEKVAVVAGPLKGIRGFVTRLKSTARVVIALESISQAVSVEVPSVYLEPLGGEKRAVAANAGEQIAFPVS
jgi:transcription antitermination factor NusG